MKIDSKEFLKYLWIASLCTVPIALMLMVKMDYNLFNTVEHNWIFLVLEIIPLLSMIMGIIYRKDNGIINIVISGIISFYFISFGIAWIFDNPKVDYNKVNEYRDILNVKLPPKGEANFNEYEGDYFVRFNYNELDIDYENKYREALLKSIKQNNHYIISNNLNKKLIKYIPANQRITHDNSFLLQDEDLLNYESYYMIYNKTTDNYNDQITKPGKYDLYVARYIPQNGHLSISNYTYIKKTKK